MPRTILVWFKNDLRLHDNETWYRACQQGNQVIPLYIFDPRKFVPHKLGFPRTGSFRAQFLIESVTALREKLRASGSDLIVKIGLPEFVITEICTENHVSDVFTGSEITDEEIRISGDVAHNLALKNIAFSTFETTTLLYPNNLPFEIQELPDQFTTFRKEVERNLIVQLPFEEPEVKPLHDLDIDKIPTVQDLGISKAELDARSVINYSGGEAAALRRMKEYIWEKDFLKTYKETRNGLVGADYSSKFSPALSLGCISARTIHYEVKKYEQERLANDSTYWLVFELLWRDYFRFVAAKYGTKIFRRQGIRKKEIKWQHDLIKFETWRTGNTGVAFVDANMKELLLTGFMSNRGRQNVASFLAKDLGIDWRWGAAWFESQLVDYDVCSNWLNWAYVTGVGNDPREDRYFNIESQTRKYDPENQYSRIWLSNG